MSGEEDEPPKLLESLLLSVSHFWSRRETAIRQVELVERHFRQDEMLASLTELAKLVGMSAPKKRTRGAAKTATRAQAEDVVAAIKQLGDEDKLPRFNVQSDDLPRVLPLLGAVSVGDERGVSARLEALEVSQRQNMDEMKRMVAAISRSAAQPAAVPDIRLSGPASFAAVAGHTVANPRVIQTTGLQAPAPRPDQFYSRQGRDQGSNNRVLTRNDRSQSNKRRREGEGEEKWREVGPRGRKPRARAKVVTGAADLVEFPNLAGPVEFWVGNTRADTNK